jgi:hypothetical protein
VARMMSKWIWKYLQNGVGIFGQEIIVATLIFPDLQLVFYTKWLSEAVIVTSDWIGTGFKFIATFFNPNSSLWWKAKDGSHY